LLIFSFCELYGSSTEQMGLQSGTCNSTPGRQGKHLTRQTQGWARQNTVLFRFKHVECLVEVELKTHLQNIETFI